MIHGPSKGFCAMISASLGFYCDEASVAGMMVVRGASRRLLLAVCSCVSVFLSTPAKISSSALLPKSKHHSYQQFGD